MFISHTIQRNKESRCYEGFFKAGLNKLYDLISNSEGGTKRADLLNPELAKTIAEARIPTCPTMEKSIQTIIKCSELTREEVIEYLVKVYLPVVLKDFDMPYFGEELVDHLLTTALGLYSHSYLSFLQKNPGIVKGRPQN